MLESNRNKLELLNNILPEKSYELFVKEQYLNLLDRTANSGGLDYWTSELNNGASKENVVDRIMNEDEYLTVFVILNMAFYTGRKEILLESIIGWKE